MATKEENLLFLHAPPLDLEDLVQRVISLLRGKDDLIPLLLDPQAHTEEPPTPKDDRRLEEHRDPILLVRREMAKQDPTHPAQQAVVRGADLIHRDHKEATRSINLDLLFRVDHQNVRLVIALIRATKPPIARVLVPHRRGGVMSQIGMMTICQKETRITKQLYFPTFSASLTRKRAI